METIEKVLLVDDDTAIRQLAEMALSQVGGLTVQACASGKEALDSILQFAPDLVLLDSNMPEMDGPETLASIRLLDGFENIPIVFLTGESRADEIERLKSLGANAVITKPFDPMSLSDSVKNYQQLA